jgi:hypothetical protein
MVGLIVVLGILLALGVGVGASIRNNSLTGAATGWAAVTMLLFWGLWALFPSLVMHAVAASLAALRDIARSVYRPV